MKFFPKNLMLLHQRLTLCGTPRACSTSTPLTFSRPKFISIRNTSFKTLFPEISWGRNLSVALKHPLVRRNLFCYMFLSFLLMHCQQSQLMKLLLFLWASCCLWEVISNGLGIINPYKQTENKCEKGKQEGNNITLKRLHRCFVQRWRKEQGKAGRKLVLLI